MGGDHAMVSTALKKESKELKQKWEMSPVPQMWITSFIQL